MRQRLSPAFHAGVVALDSSLVVLLKLNVGDLSAGDQLLRSGVAEAPPGARIPRSRPEHTGPLRPPHRLHPHATTYVALRGKLHVLMHMHSNATIYIVLLVNYA